MHQAMAGVQIPIAKIPDGVNFHPGDESPYAGRADFYFCRYGDYVIEMNSSKDKPHALEVPPGVTDAIVRDLVSRQAVPLSEKTEIPPRSTMILWLGAPGSSIEASK
jgi:hypothetical protein